MSAIWGQVMLEAEMGSLRDHVMEFHSDKTTNKTVKVHHILRHKIGGQS